MSGDRYKIADPNGVYFVTFTVVDWVDVFTRLIYKDIITENLNFYIKNKGLEIYAWCLMSNHLHAIMSATKGNELPAIIRDYKKYTSKAIVEAIQKENESRREWMLHRFEFAGNHDSRITHYKFWQEGNHAIWLDPNRPALWTDKVKYIHDNPVRAGIVGKPVDYLYSSAIDYAGGKGLVNIKADFI